MGIITVKNFIQKTWANIMTFSICIPNYNYEKYLGLTIESVLHQEYKDFELLIADNQSTDQSLNIIQDFAEKNSNIRYKVNPTNVGFAGNLDQVAQMAKKDFLIMLSSDDIIKKNALIKYNLLINAAQDKNLVISSSWDVIDASGEKIGFQGPNATLWKIEDIDKKLSEHLGCKVYKVSSSILLKRCLAANSNPFNFCTTCYPFEAYQQVGGYGQSRLMNPDKWFHWRLLSKVNYAYFVDSPFFQYRWHDKNQTAQQKNSGHLKYVTDEYRGTIDMNKEILDTAGITKNQYYQIFLDKVIFQHGLGELSKGLWLKAMRIFFFGWATYPQLMFKKFGRSISYKLLLLSGPIGILLLRLIKKR